MDYIPLKVMLLGDIGVGKTSLVRRLVLDRFDADYKATIGVDIYRKDIYVGPDHDPLPVKLLIWDLDGDLGESIFQHRYITGASCALIMGDTMRPATLASMTTLAERFQDLLPGRPVAFVVNKMDLLPEGQDVELPPVIESMDIPLAKTSAKTGLNVERPFHILAKEAIRCQL